MSVNNSIITPEEQKQIMLEMLRFLDKICRKNNIKYSLIGGSLIGAIRHKGYIPWDDDIDIILTEDNYSKLKSILDKETGRYQTLKYGRGGEQFTFIKLIDTYTRLEEECQSRKIPDYGVFVDIFCYYGAPDNEKMRRKYFKKIQLMVSLIARRKMNFKDATLKQIILRMGKNIASTLLGYGGIRMINDRLFGKYKKTKYVVSNWPSYRYEKEIQLRENVEEYIDAKFEGLDVMIFKNYDAILRTSFGDYMKLPPLADRKPRHTMKIWWRDLNEKNKK